MRMKALGFLLLVTFSSPQMLWAAAELKESSSVVPWEADDVPPVGIAAKLFTGLGIRDVMPETAYSHTDFLNYSEISKLKIPLEAKYDSYSAMFICRDLTKEQKEKVPSIYKAFHSFARHIGSKNVGVWIGQDTPPAFDAGEGKSACDFFGLMYNGGPYVVHYKIEGASPQLGAVGITLDSTVINFHGVQTERIPAILNILEQGVRTGRIASGWLRYEQVVQVLLSFMSENSDFVKELITGAIIHARPTGSVSLRPSRKSSVVLP